MNASIEMRFSRGIFLTPPLLGYDRDEIAKSCPNCERAFNETFTHLPIYGLSQEQLDFMADAILEVISEMQNK